MNRAFTVETTSLEDLHTTKHLAFEWQKGLIKRERVLNGIANRKFG